MNALCRIQINSFSILIENLLSFKVIRVHIIKLKLNNIKVFLNLIIKRKLMIVVINIYKILITVS